MFQVPNFWRWITLLLFFGFSSNILSGQCHPQANFTVYRPFTCVVIFVPNPASPFEGAASHSWRIEEPGGAVCVTNTTAPHHTYAMGIYTSTVTHTVSVTSNGITTQFSCVQTIEVDCGTGCGSVITGTERSTSNFSVFEYQVEGCTLTVSGVPGEWDFGDGTGFVTGSQITHVYQSSGTYNVCHFYDNVWCCRDINVECSLPNCCDAEFTATIKRECSALYLEPKPICRGGSDKWEVVGSCAFLVGARLQLTNVNTDITPEVQIKHTYTCPNGNTVSVVKTIPIPEEGVFVGIVDELTQLSKFDCALPGGGYTGALPVYVTGVINLDKSFSFSSTRIFMHPNITGFDVPAGRELRLSAQCLAQSAPGCGCMWRGIYVWGGFIMDKSTVADAVFASRAYGNSVLSFFDSDFKRNFIDLRATDGAFTLRRFQRNRLNGEGSLKDICALAPIIKGLNDNIGNPVTFNPERGYAGLYIRELPRFTLTALPIGEQNIFNHSAYGIMLFDVTTTITRNSRFEDIRTNALASVGSSGIAFYDGLAGGGANGLRVAGNNNLLGSVPPDFNRCSAGIICVSGVTMGKTGLDLRNCTMDAMQSGIVMLGSGMLGNQASGLYKGIYNNVINANQSFIGNSTAGISIIMNNPNNFGALEIQNNRITTRGQSGHCVYIVVFSNKNDGKPQYDIHDNRMVLEQGTAGIFTLGSSDIWIHDNRNTGGNGNGIYINGTQPGNVAGVELSGGGGNLVACNDIVTGSAVSDVKGLSIDDHENGIFSRNQIAGPADVAANFNGICGTQTVFRCNTMSNAVTGLYYENMAITGQQGSPTDPSGNQWLNNTEDLKRGVTVIVLASQYFYRNQPGEVPNNVSLHTTWFTPVNASHNTAVPDCKLTCPVSAEWRAEPSFSDLDSLVAEEALQSGGNFTVADWWAAFNLYSELYAHPALRAGHGKAGDFYAALASSPTARFVETLDRLAQALQMPPAQATLTQNEATALEGKVAQLSVLDSLAILAADNGQALDSIQQQQQQTLLSEITEHQRAIRDLFLAAQVQGAQAAENILADLGNAQAGNICETNGKQVLQWYVKVSAQGYVPSAAERAALRAIAAQCPSEGGPAVYWARALYQIVTLTTTEFLDCHTGGRPESAKDRDNTEVAGISLWPVPTQERLEIQVAGKNPGVLTVFDAWGNTIATDTWPGKAHSLDVSALRPGLYVLRLQIPGKAPLAKSFVVLR